MIAAQFFKRQKPDDGGEMMGLEAWIAEVQKVATFVIEADEWRRHHDAGLSPVDPIAQHRTDEDI